jgi:hypothetical protein
VTRQQRVAWLRTRVAVKVLMLDALEGALPTTPESHIPQVAESQPPQIPTKLESRPRPLLLLPSNSNFVRRLMRGIVHRR